MLCHGLLLMLLLLLINCGMQNRISAMKSENEKLKEEYRKLLTNDPQLPVPARKRVHHGPNASHAAAKVLVKVTRNIFCHLSLWYICMHVCLW